MAYNEDTLAEMHLHEYLLTLLRTVDDAFKIFEESITYFDTNKVDMDRIYQKILEPKRRVEEGRVLFMEYLIRLGEGLTNSTQYASIALGLEKIVQHLEGVVYRLALLKKKGFIVDGAIQEKLIEQVSTLKQMYKSLSDGLEKLKNDPRKTLVRVDEINKFENKGDENYRELTFTIYTKLADQIIPLMVFKDIADFIEEACDIIKSIGEELRYLALYRIMIS